MSKVRCDNCMTVFEENEIMIDEANNKEICPACGACGCLMDVKDQEEAKVSKKGLISILEYMVHDRMTVSDMNYAIEAYIECENTIQISKSDLHWDDPDIPDYNLIGSTEKAHQENEDIPFCDFDIYVLPTKETKNDETVYYITEVGYEFS